MGRGRGRIIFIRSLLFKDNNYEGSLPKWLIPVSILFCNIFFVMFLLTVFEELQEAPWCDLLIGYSVIIIVYSIIFMLLFFLGAVTIIFLVFFSSSAFQVISSNSGDFFIF